MDTTEELGKTYHCDKCGKNFNLQSKFYLHKVKHEIHKYQLAFKSWTCSCGLVFHREWHLAVHQREHALQKKWHYCPQCGECFTSQMCLTKHQFQDDHLSRKLKSQESVIYRCGVSDPQQADVGTTEESNVTDECEDDDFDTHICNICGEASESKWVFECHRNIHFEESLYYCKLCDSSFRTSSSLELHLQVHSRRSYKCFFCPKAYIRKSFLGRHLNVHAFKADVVGGVQRYICALCDRQTTGKRLTKHHFVHMYDFIRKYYYETKHPKSKTKSKRKANGNWTDIKRKLAQQSKDAKRKDAERYMERRQMQDTANVEGSRTIPRHARGECICVGDVCKCYMCSLCGMNFTAGDLWSHLEVHTGQLIQCEKCEKTFTNNFHFKRHTENCVYTSI